ncbi:bifunctional folylpolyglutamate synthase dihydrofolate synthase : Folylpolyglutamate synthase/dihydrofolate synthase OS=Singulisphaera acidiphila (strain ATCC BAA-1392 / DSM 18658 / VKM B-2454 / MOB10) GN=Sinac_5224 PE=4 SV=1: Mur_ligase_M: Mur_ligase_C [Gemmata massiliana]|uniref:Dihydrofolate synthase/folylpolyglutamate synthase n=1 Tax=Gemmata massiliana TaxID=1210884 RepID=A0A6P2CWP7_9BACT|nr:folylpolyglutamate synthase/dihydrofolate synthase family protein [Gemmata massiliana]VTR91522.1 bifunctional folylpolyglutamate synthase dihydrofolate synthase : Folylpolyglutamate synthase/dihydrofolate synthase OS=Singulisphaera acidiphila (strain ATCC BAA-1392 / DSM 18658 / VKM B-2454 / MOB10) GN=Sinac_5224 PE=4 SV=1: Mur_ligase_M: Mur_ligase_C [Gemmata massiliana]
MSPTRFGILSRRGWGNRMTYDEAISFWYGRINYEVRSAGPLDLKLERMHALLRRLGDPQDWLRLVHVTGTKGKGSTCAMLASVLRAAGYRVGLFTSPHLEHVEERMQVDGVPISHAEMVARMEEVAPAVRAMEEEAPLPSPTFFEIGTALGFLHFVRRRVDIAILEVGLGGRFDSTNVCHPLVSVITNIGFDHTAQLGNTLEAIAYQKAGIIKRRVPVVSGVSQPGPRAVIREVATEMGAPLWEVGAPNAPLSLNLLGAHQVQNAATALSVVERLRETGMPIPDGAVARGLANVKWPARVEVIRERPVVILDTAHNVPSAEALVNTLRASFPQSATKRVVFAVSSDKQFADILRILAGYFNHFYLTKYGNNPRCVPPEKLAATLAAVAPGTSFTVHATAPGAWREAHSATAAGDLVCVTGSVFLAGELRSVLSEI